VTGSAPTSTTEAQVGPPPSTRTCSSTSEAGYTPDR
jgi:hypothetical protein